MPATSVKTFRIAFYTPGCHFEACREAEAWCKARDISIGTCQRNEPRGLALGSYAISKWQNLRPHERGQLDGVMTGDMRSGPVYISLRGNLEDYSIVGCNDA